MFSWPVFTTTSLHVLCTVAIGQNQPLVHEQEEWTSEMPLTEGQLRGKRDTFWETSPVYEGRKEIWDALRAACEAVEDEDYELAQAIVDGASVSLPRGMMGCVVNASNENRNYGSELRTHKTWQETMYISALVNCHGTCTFFCGIVNILFIRDQVTSTMCD